MFPDFRVKIRYPKIISNGVLLSYNFLVIYFLRGRVGEGGTYFAVEQQGKPLTAQCTSHSALLPQGDNSRRSSRLHHFRPQTTWLEPCGQYHPGNFQASALLGGAWHGRESLDLGFRKTKQKTHLCC